MAIITGDNLGWEDAAKALKKWIRNGSGLDGDHVFWAYEGKARPKDPPYIVMSVQQVRPVGHDWSTYDDNAFEFPDLVVSSVSGSTMIVPDHPFATGDGPVQFLTTGALPTPLQLATDYWVIVSDQDTIKLAAKFTDTGGQQPLGAGNAQAPITLTSSGSGVHTITPTIDTVKAGEEIIHRSQGFREVVVHLDCFVGEGQGYNATRILSNVIAAVQLNVYDLDQAGVGVSDLGQAFSQGGVVLVEGHRGGILEPRAMVDITFYMASNLEGFETRIDEILLPFRVPVPSAGPWSSGFSSNSFGG